MFSQKDKVNHLLQLLKDNPELEIVPMVDCEVCGGDDYSWWIGSWGTASVDEYWSDDEKIYFRSESEDELIDDAIDEEWPEEMTDEKIEKAASEKVNSYKWTKCICVKINTP